MMEHGITQQTLARDKSGRSSAQRPRARWGIFVRKERWGLSWRGRLLFVLAVGVTLYVLVSNAYSFLAVTHRVNTRVLVIEGWIHNYTIHVGVAEFRNGSYEHVFTTGGPENWIGGYANDFQTSASVGAEQLKKAGVPDESLTMVPSHVVGRDRTYNAAVALRDWFRDHHMIVHTLNILTEDCHARRSQLLYQEAFGKDVQIGVIAVADPDYDARYWWRYSDGVREVIGESIAYIYAKFFFFPPPSPEQKEVHEPSQASR